LCTSFRWVFNQLSLRDESCRYVCAFSCAASAVTGSRQTGSLESWKSGVFVTAMNRRANAIPAV
jgi:hypothetical protein